MLVQLEPPELQVLRVLWEWLVQPGRQELRVGLERLVLLVCLVDQVVPEQRVLLGQQGRPVLLVQPAHPVQQEYLVFPVHKDLRALLVLPVLKVLVELLV